MSELRVVATGLCFPEGPIAMRDGSIVLVEIERQTLSRVFPDGRVKVIARNRRRSKRSGHRPGRRLLHL
jgi:gluconolactonase